MDADRTVNAGRTVFRKSSELQQRPAGVFQRIQLRVCICPGGSLRAEVELEFRLGAGGADDDRGAAGERKGKHIRTRKTGRVCQVVGECGDRESADAGRRIAAQALHDRCHLRHCGGAGEGEALLRMDIAAEALVKCVDGIGKRHAALLVPACRFAEQEHGVDAVLVTHMCAGEIAIALFKAEGEALRVPLAFQKTDLFANVFKAGECAAKLCAAGFRDGVCHGGGDNRGDGNGALGKRSGSFSCAADEIEQQHADLVAGEQTVGALVRDGNAAAVAVRVSADEKIGLYDPAQLESFLHCLADLGVRIRAGREIAVRLCLFGDEREILNAEFLKKLFHTLSAGAVEGRIDETQAGKIVFGDAQGANGVYVGVQQLVRNPSDAAGGKKRGKVSDLDTIKIGTILKIVRDLRHARRGQLAAVGAVDLEAVILRGIMAGGDADANAAGKCAHRKAQGGHRLEAGVNVCFDTICRKDGGSFPGKAGAADSAVVADGSALGKGGSAQIVGNRLRGAADDVDVHAVGACAEDAAKTAGAEGQLAAEGIVDGMRVVRHRGKLGAKTCVQRGLGQPAVILDSGRVHFVLLFRKNDRRKHAPVVLVEAQKVKLPEVMQRPDLRSKSMIWSPVTERGTEEPMVNRELPKTTPVSRKPPTRTLMVDSMPVGIAP